MDTLFVPPVRRCPRCERTLDTSQFNKNKSTATGLQTYCRECHRQVQAERRSKPGERECPVCGRRFTPKSNKGIYCHPNCKQKALKRRRRPTGRTCGICGKNIDHMRTDAKWCSEDCMQIGTSELRKRSVRKSRLKNQYGITLEEFDLMLDAQGGVCAICHTEEIRGYGKRLAIDHCHDTGKVRGILCGNCNRGIGAFHHNPTTLRVAVAYLDK